jgi:hypothetical protein
MRNFIIIRTLLLSLFSCRQVNNSFKKNSWTEQEIKQYFIDSIAMGNGDYDNKDSLNKFPYFMKTFYNNSNAINYWDEFIYALDEPYIDTTNIEKNKQWLRVIVKPTFSNPFCITLEKIKNKTKLSLKLTNGQGGYFSGYLTMSNFSYFKDSLYNSYYSRLDKINFWRIKGEDSTCHRVLDGTAYVFEAIDKGIYNVVYRYTPSVCTSKESKELSKIGEDLFKVADLEKFWKIQNNE